MANEDYVNKGTSKLVNNGTGSNVAWTMEGLANAAGRVSAQIDWGAVPRPSNDVAGGESRWLEPAALVTGVAGTRPTFRFNRMLNNSASTEGCYHYPPWQTRASR